MEINEKSLVNYFDNIPEEILFYITLKLSSNDIMNMCYTCSRFNDDMCNNNFFWKKKFIKDHGHITFGNYGDIDNYIQNIPCWKFFYFNINNVWVFGRNTSSIRGSNIDSNVPILLPQIRGKYLSFGHSYLSNSINHYIVHRSALIDNKYNIRVWGDNTNGGLGGGDIAIIKKLYKINNIKVKQASLGRYGTLLLDTDNNVWFSGRVGHPFMCDYPQPYNPNLYFIQLQSFKAKFVSIGGYHMSLIDFNDNVWVCGTNRHGELGLQTRIFGYNNLTLLSGFKAKQISCGYKCTALIDMRDNIWTFGKNISGMLGLGDDDDRNIPTKIHGLKARQISVSLAHIMIIDLEGNLWGIGRNNYGELGLLNIKKTNIPIKIEHPRSIGIVKITWKYVSTSNTMSMALDKNNDIWVSGSGILGFGVENDNIYNFKQIIGFKATKISCGGNSAGFIGTQINQ